LPGKVLIFSFRFVALSELKQLYLFKLSPKAIKLPCPTPLTFFIFLEHSLLQAAVLLHLFWHALVASLSRLK